MSTEHYFQRHSRLILFTFTKKLRSLSARAQDFWLASLKFKSTRVRALLRKTIFYWVNPESISVRVSNQKLERHKYFQVFSGLNNDPHQARSGLRSSPAGRLKLWFKLLADWVFRSCLQVFFCQFCLLAAWKDLNSNFSTIFKLKYLITNVLSAISISKLELWSIELA